jgi:hypothetical protein
VPFLLTCVLGFFVLWLTLGTCLHCQFVDVKTQLAQQVTFTKQLLAEKEGNVRACTFQGFPPNGMPSPPPVLLYWYWGSWSVCGTDSV